ncbi:uncharacterized protein LODBEIA_P24200 [Lodderomyces beijingensis]|uniref:Uncharacterized protein n=1 Tax=Lodderomyces beijingensis TaxID=1775926 RepID=A0ABP0ZM56_9ASCO
MSNLRSQLGPQGRAVLDRSSRVQHGSQTGQVDYSPQELDYVIDELRNPKPDLTINKVLGYIYNYIPYIKHEKNLGLVFSSFLNCPVCFGGGGGNSAPPASFEELYPVIEVFKLIADKKLKVSQPTLSVRSFYTIIGRELENFVAYNPFANCWKALPIVCGLFLSNSLRDELYSSVNFFKYGWFFRDWDLKMKKLFVSSLQYSLSRTHAKTVVFLSVASLALIYHRDENVKHYTGKIDDRFMVDVLVDMIFLDERNSALAYRQYFDESPNNPHVETITQKNILQKPVIKHLNKFSFLLASYLSHLKFTEPIDQLIQDTLRKITNFNHTLSQSCSSSIFNSFTASKDSSSLFQSFWFFMKNLLFAEVIIFQGLFTRFLTGNNKSNMNWFSHGDLAIIDRDYRSIALKTIPNLYYLNFILLSIGQGGFDTYNFVYYLSVELALSTGSYFESLTMSLISNYQEINMYPDVLNRDYIMQSKVLFVLGLWENFLQSKTIYNEKFAKEIYNVTKTLADDKRYDNDDLIEASHSVLLFYFANSKNVNLQDCVEYVNLLIKQFPNRISATQLCIAIETIGKQILSNPHPSPPNSRFANSAEEFFFFLLDKCAPIQLGYPITKTEENPNFVSAQPISEIGANSTLHTLKQDKQLDNDIVQENKAKKPKDKVVRDLFPKFKKEYKYEQRLLPETAREAAIVALINLVPYFPISVFTAWVEKIWDLIVKSNESEKEYLVGMLWKVLSDSLDLNRVELAMRWWYDVQQIPQQNHQVAKM